MHRRTALQTLSLFTASTFLSFADEATVQPQPVTISLAAVANQKLTDDQHGFKGNNLAKLELGEHNFLNVKFRIDAGYLALSGDGDDEKPKKIEGIKVGASALRLHFLHATGYGEAGFAVSKDATIAEYVVHYADESTAKIPVVYGQDVRDWWAWSKPPEVTKGKIAWTGTNEYSEQNNQKIRLYLTTWDNPKPGVKILKIDYTVGEKTSAAPFCIAITAEP